VAAQPAPARGVAGEVRRRRRRRVTLMLLLLLLLLLLHFRRFAAPVV
jgi:cell division protein FtsB